MAKQRRSSTNGKKPYTSGKNNKPDYDEAKKASKYDKSNGRSSKSDKRVGASKTYDDAKTRYNGTQTGADSAKNDASWYTYSPEVVGAAANINYLQPVGQPYYDGGVADRPDRTISTGAPSLIDIKYTITPGMSDDYPLTDSDSVTAPINLQLRSLYTMIQSTVTQNLPFASSDLGIHLLFADQVFSFFAHMQRFYYLYRYYRVLNRTVPSVFLSAYGMTESAIKNSKYTIADFQLELLNLEQELSRLFIPSGFDAFNRHYWLNKHVFLDAPDPKAQMYMFSPNAVWKYVIDPAAGDVRKMSHLELVPVPNFGSIEAMVTFFRTTLLAPFYADKDIWNINGYLLRAFPPENAWHVDTLDPSGIIEPAFSPEVLTQIHNVRVCGDLAGPEYNPQNTETGRIYQTLKDTVAWRPQCPFADVHGNAGNTSKHVFFDMPMPNPTLADNLVASRLTVQGENAVIHDPSGNIIGNAFIPKCFGTEIVNRLIMHVGATGTTVVNWSDFKLSVWSQDSTGVVTSTQNDFYALARLSHFAMAPMLPITTDHNNASGASEPSDWVEWVGDITNYTIIAPKDLRKLHEAAILGS